jgi:predicted DNA-binding protein (UPF0251 family)
MEEIKALIILEILGKPPEHLNEVLGKIIEQLKEEKGITIENINYKEPKELKENPNYYTTFAEIEFNAKSVIELTRVLFKYMPAHVEISSPEEIRMTNDGLNEVVMELMRRLHQYEEVTRNLQIEKKILEKKLKRFLDEKKN